MSTRLRRLPLVLCLLTVLAALFLPFHFTLERTTSAQAPQECNELPPSAFVNDVGTVFLDVVTLGQATGFGYDLVNSNGHLFGQVIPTPNGSSKIAEDGDWGVFVTPLPVIPGFTSNVGLSTGFDNDNNFIETEICNECTGRINARLPIPGDCVQVNGMHVTDNSHGSGVPGFGGKTEIHPVQSYQIVEGGASRPNPNEETFRIAVGAGGTCPDYSFARVSALAVASRTDSLNLSWPAPPTAVTGITFVPAMEVNELTAQGFQSPAGPGFMQIQPFTAITGPFPMNGNFSGAQFSPWHVNRTGNSVNLTGSITVQTGSGFGPFESTEGRSIDIRTFWVPLELQLILDSVEDLGIQHNRAAFPVRSYRIRAHANVGGDDRIQGLLANLEWRLHPTNTGFSSPGPTVIGSGTTLDYTHDIAPSHALSAYNLRLELAAPAVPLSVSRPISLPRPSVSIKQMQQTEDCTTLPDGTRARHITVQMEAESYNFAAGPNYQWTITPYPLPAGAPPVVTASGQTLTHEFFISPATPTNYFRVVLTASDPDNVETAVDADYLDFVPVVQILCQQITQGPGGSSRLSVEVMGMPCNTLQYLWGTGEPTPTIIVNRPPVDPRWGDDSVSAEVAVTDASGQQVRLHSYVCGSAFGTLRALRHIEDIEKRALYARVNQMRDMMTNLGLVKCDPRSCDPPPDKFGRFANWMKHAVMSADGAPPGAVKQRAAFINKMLTKTRETGAKNRRGVLRNLITKALNDIKTGKYKETMKASVAFGRSEWSQNVFRQVDALIGRSTRPPR